MIKVCESLADLHNRLSKKSRESRDFEIGVSNLAIATSELTSQGEEIWWQPRAAWNSACFFDDLFARDIRFNLVLGRVLKIKSGSVTYHDQISQKQLIQDGFDIIFVAAGCIGSTEIIIRSKDLGHRELEDNRTYSFPIIRPLAKIKLGKKTNDSVTLSNLTILGRTDKGDTPFMISIYPFPTHFLRYYLPKMFWKLADFLSRMIRQHLCLGRLCIGDQHNRRYSLAILDDKLSLEDKHECTPSNADLRSQVKKIFERTGFIALTSIFSEAPNSSHYGVSLSNDICKKTNQISDNVYLVDSSSFPTMPGISPTLTIAANAARVATRALEKKPDDGTKI